MEKDAPVSLARRHRRKQVGWKCFFSQRVFSRARAHANAEVCAGRLPGYTSRANRCLRAEIPISTSRRRRFNALIDFQTQPSERASGNPPVTVLPFAGPPPVAAAFYKDPEQQKKAQSGGGASHSQKLRVTGAAAHACFNAVLQNSRRAVGSVGGGGNGRVETGQYRLAGKGPTSEAVTVKRLGWERANSESPSRNAVAEPFRHCKGFFNHDVFLNRHYPTSVWFLIQMWK